MPAQIPAESAGMGSSSFSDTRLSPFRGELAFSARFSAEHEANLGSNLPRFQFFFGLAEWDLSQQREAKFEGVFSAFSRVCERTLSSLIHGR